MVWYYYSGDTTKPIPDGKGNIIAVRPNTKIEIFKESPFVKRLISKRKLRITSKPVKNVPKVTEIKEVEGVDVKKTEFSVSVAEKGKTKSRDSEPKKEVGVVGMTAGEMSKMPNVDSSEAVVNDDGVEQVEKKHRRGRRLKKTDSQS